MEYILINEGKLKVMLELADLEEFDINAEDLDYANPVAKPVFEDILRYAREEFGFDTSGHKVLLQLFPSRDGGCELFITRLPSLCEQTKSQPKVKESVAYSFGTLSNLLAVCKRLLSKGFNGKSSAWADSQGRWYLLLSESDMLDLHSLPIPHELSFIEEYGESQSPRALSLYLGEYAQSICEGDAVRTLGEI